MNLSPSNFTLMKDINTNSIPTINTAAEILTTTTEDSSDDHSKDYYYAKLFYTNLIDYTKSALEHILVLLSIYTFGCILLYWLLCHCRKWTRWFGMLKTVKLPSVKRVLIITAHPDDESMFFGPTIVGLKQQDENCRIFVLCLSNGMWHEFDTYHFDD